MYDPSLIGVRATAQDPYDRLQTQIRNLQAQVDALARIKGVPVVAGQPATANTGDGAMALDSTQPRLWVIRNGAAVYATLSG